MRGQNQEDNPRQVSLAEMLPINGSIGREHLLVVLKSYFDGGNKADSALHDLLTLASVSGTKKLWHPFEVAWKKNLRKHKAAFLHVTDAIGFHGIYEGWNVAKRDDFISDCVDVALQHIARANKPGEIGRYGIYPSIIVVNIKDFVASAKANPGHPQNINQSCARHSLANVIWWAENKAACSECHLFFDQGEPFRGCVVQITQSKKAKRDAPGLKMITSTTEADSRQVPALQLADLYAWCLAHQSSGKNLEWLDRLLTNDFHQEYYAGADITKVDQRAVALFDSWKIPKVAPTR